MWCLCTQCWDTAANLWDAQGSGPSSGNPIRWLLPDNRAFTSTRALLTAQCLYSSIPYKSNPQLPCPSDVLSKQGMEEIISREKLVRTVSGLKAHLLMPVHTETWEALKRNCCMHSKQTRLKSLNFHFKGQKNRIYFILLSFIWVPGGNGWKSRWADVLNSHGDK